MKLFVFRFAALLFCILGSSVSAWADDPLHVQIDHQIESALQGAPLAGMADDAEFLRRVYLDLAGRIPTAAEAEKFLNDPSKDKRAKLIDQLLASKDYPRRMTELFNAMLMERRGENEHWTAFLRHAFQSNLAWDEIARSILNPNADDEQTRGAAFFLTARLVSEGAMAAVDTPGTTRDVGRMFAGVDLQCAQCHDHISVNDYLQADFQGLLTIIENLKPRRDVEFPAVSEAVMVKKADFMSVFTQEANSTGPRAPGAAEVEIAVFEKGEEYRVPPDRKTRHPGAPKFSPLEHLANDLATVENPLFQQNIVNRIWFVMMGRGLVEPLDLQHGDNPPSHPQLLTLLAEDFAAHQFDLKYLLREIALSKAYQRSSQLPSGESPDPRSYAVANEKRLSAEQLFWSALTAIGALEQAQAKKGQADLSLEQLVEKSKDLKALRKDFLSAFANPPKEPEIDFEPTVKGALYLLHEDRWLSLLKPVDGNTTQRLLAMDDSAAVHSLYVTIFTRPPTTEEQADIVGYLGEQPDRAAALADIAWAMLASTEFVVNH